MPRGNLGDRNRKDAHRASPSRVLSLRRARALRPGGSRRPLCPSLCRRQGYIHEIAYRPGCADRCFADGAAIGIVLQDDIDATQCLAQDRLQGEILEREVGGTNHHAGRRSIAPGTATTASPRHTPSRWTISCTAPTTSRLSPSAERPRLIQSSPSKDRAVADQHRQHFGAADVHDQVTRPAGESTLSPHLIHPTLALTNTRTACHARTNSG